jgi:neutral ceramidase
VRKIATPVCSRMAVGGLLVLFSIPPALAATLKAGVAKVDITPPLGVQMWGYEDRKTASQGVLDPLYARVLVLEAGDKRVALVTLDLGRTFGAASIARLREEARNNSGMSFVLLAASHTHGGPEIEDAYPKGGTPAWESADLDKIAKAIQEAHEHVVTAQLGTGHGTCYIGHNRLRVNPDGTVTWFERNTTMIPTSPIDPTVSVLRVDTSEGKPLAILVNYACHPVVFGSDNLKYSADYPAVMANTIEQAFGGQPICMFLQGGDGDINPYYAVTPIEEDAVGRRNWTGERLGREAARVAESIHSQPAPDASLDFAEDPLTFHLRWKLENFRDALRAAFGPQMFAIYAPLLQEEMQLPVATLLINKRIAFMTMPGEPFVDFQSNWRDRCPVPDAFFVGYAGGYYGYFPTIHAATLGGYGAASVTTWVEPGAGERMVDHAILKTYELLGKLHDLPEDLKASYSKN